MEPYLLPKSIEESCLRIAKNLGLIMTGIDFKLTDKNEFYCLEVNPAPGFLYFEWQTRQPICSALSDILEKNSKLIFLNNFIILDRIM